MILVTIGTIPFDRLIMKMDDISRKIQEEVIIQIGNSEYKPKNAKFFNFTESYEEMRELNRKARIVVAHAGIGSIITALEQVKPIIVVPRLKKYRESVDDHQLEIAQMLSKEEKVTAVYDMEELEKVLQDSDIKPIRIIKDKKLIHFIRNYLERWSK